MGVLSLFRDTREYSISQACTWRRETIKESIIAQLVPLEEKISISPTLRLLGLFLSLWNASSTHDGLSSPPPYLTMHRRSSQIAGGIITSVLFANTESMCFMVCSRPIKNNLSKYLLVLRPGRQLARSPKSFRVLCRPQSTEVLQNSDSCFVSRWVHNSG